MKKSIYFSFILAATLATTSCDLEAPTKSTIKEDIVFSTERLADAAIMGIHQSFGETNSIEEDLYLIMVQIPIVRFSTIMVAFLIQQQTGKLH